MCRVLGVSPSGYYAWRRREPSARSVSDAQLTALIGQVHTWSRGTYGVPRMVRELRARGPHVNPKRVARLMREAGWQGVSRRQSTRTTRREPGRRCFPTHAVARREIFDYIEAWYNRHRRHSALNYESPMNFERRVA